jgi:hypothetical protein
LNDEERAYFAQGGTLIIGMMTGTSGPYPILPAAAKDGDLDQYELVNLTKELGNGLSPEMLEPRGDNKEACLVHLTRGAWLGFMMAIINNLPATEDRTPQDRMLLATLGLIERQINNQKDKVPTTPPADPAFTRPKKSGRSSDNIVEEVGEPIED